MKIILKSLRVYDFIAILALIMIDYSTPAFGIKYLSNLDMGTSRTTVHQK